MASTDLVYRFLGIDAGASAQFDRMGARTAALGRTSSVTAAHIGRLAKAATLASVAIGAASVKAAIDYQSATTRLVTGAGESAKGLVVINAALRKQSVDLGVGMTELAKSLYPIESAGFHAGRGIEVLRAAVQGAKVDGAQTATVADALTTALNAYSLGAKSSVAVTDQMVAAVRLGKTTMEDLAGSLGNAVPEAAALNIPLSQVLAAMSTMTFQGTDAAKASQYLRYAMASLANPTSKAQKTLASMGLSAHAVADAVSSKGLSGGFRFLEDQIAKKFPRGSSAYLAAMANIVGGTRGLQAALELTGRHAKEFASDTNLIGQASRHAGKDVTHWAMYLHTTAAQLQRMLASVQGLAIGLGQVLIPAVTSAAKFITNNIVPALSSLGHFLKANAVWTKPLAVALGAGVTALYAFSKAAKFAKFAVAALGLAADANPIGLIITGIAAATAAFIYFYKTSETFRHVVQRVFVDLATVVGKWAQVNLTMLRYVADGMLSFVGTIVHAASSAFGWIPGIGGQLKGAAHDFDNFKASTLNTLSSLATDAGNLGSYAGSLFATNFVNSAQINAAGGGTGKNSPFRDPGHVGFVAPSTHHAAGLTLPAFTGGGTGGGGGGGSVATAGKSAAAVLHITAKNLTRALAKGLLDGWQGYALTVRESLSTGTQHLLEQLGKQFEAIQKRMTTLVENAKTKLHDALTNERQYVQQMMSDAGLGNVPTVDSGYTGQTTRLTSIGAFLGSQAKNYALFDRLLRRLGHSGLSKGLVSQIAQMGPTQGIQYAQQILSGGAGSIAQLNAYQKQIARSAKAIGQDQFGSQVAADRKNLRRQTQLQQEMRDELKHLARDIGREVAANVHPGKGGISGKPSGLSVHEAKQLQRDLNKLDRLVGKKK